MTTISQSFPLLTAMANGRPLSELALELKFEIPTFHGHRSLIIHPGVVDDAAVEAYAYGQCRPLAGALADVLRGGVFVVSSHIGGVGWKPSHYAALTRGGVVVDIRGQREQEAVVRHLRTDIGPTFPVRTDEIPLWDWAAEVTPIEAELARTMASAVLNGWTSS